MAENLLPTRWDSAEFLSNKASSTKDSRENFEVDVLSRPPTISTSRVVGGVSFDFYLGRSDHFMLEYAVGGLFWVKIFRSFPIPEVWNLSAINFFN